MDLWDESPVLGNPYQWSYGLYYDNLYRTYDGCSLRSVGDLCDSLGILFLVYIISGSDQVSSVSCIVMVLYLGGSQDLEFLGRSFGVKDKSCAGLIRLHLMQLSKETGDFLGDYSRQNRPSNAALRDRIKCEIDVEQPYSRKSPGIATRLDLSSSFKFLVVFNYKQYTHKLQKYLQSRILVLDFGCPIYHEMKSLSVRRQLTPLGGESQQTLILLMQLHTDIHRMSVTHPTRPTRTSEPTAIGWALDILMSRRTTSELGHPLDVMKNS
ncbi:hypothetical protein OUZ56_005574 [Daphnia magna]|uniref:Uncharacterized protein n=1 Tax=Daphnia magna TaxID=35525 RepID=A0ABQ9YT52_9CRUS|nr:hypothetical protein OUZ56_005574 [Daphnia magna]